MPPSNPVLTRITGEAESLMAQTPEELEYSFRLAWAKSREGTSLPHRGGDDFWRNARKRLAKEIAKNSAAGSVTIGMIATHVVQWAEASGIDLVRFEAPISIYVALVAKSVLDELGSQKDGNDTTSKEDPTKKEK